MTTRRAMAAACSLATLLLAASGPAAGADEPYLEVDPEACDRLAAHVPDDDVTYQPGVDAHGNPVAPADLNPPIVTPDVFYIPLEVDVRDRFGIPADPTFFDGDILIGTVTVDGDRVTYNGQDLTDPQAATLAALCRDR